MKGVAKCDEQCELQNSVNQQGLERICCCWAYLTACLFQCAFQFSRAVFCTHETVHSLGCQACSVAVLTRADAVGILWVHSRMSVVGFGHFKDDSSDSLPAGPCDQDVKPGEQTRRI